MLIPSRGLCAVPGDGPVGQCQLKHLLCRSHFDSKYHQLTSWDVGCMLDRVWRRVCLTSLGLSSETDIVGH